MYNTIPYSVSCSCIWRLITLSDITWASLHLKSPATWLFVQYLWCRNWPCQTMVNSFTVATFSGLCAYNARLLNTDIRAIRSSYWQRRKFSTPCKAALWYNRISKLYKVNWSWKMSVRMQAQVQLMFGNNSNINTLGNSADSFDKPLWIFKEPKQIWEDPFI